MLDVHISTEVSVIILQRSDASYTKPANLQCVTVACQCTNFLNFQLETADRADNYCWHMAPPPTGAHDKSRSWGNNLIAPCVLNNLENPISLWQQMLHNSLPLYLAVIINTWGVGRKWKRKKKKWQFYQSGQWSSIFMAHVKETRTAAPLGLANYSRFSWERPAIVCPHLLIY